MRFKLCTFSRSGTQGAGLVMGDNDTIYDIVVLQELGKAKPLPGSIRSMVEDWDASFARLSELAGWVRANGSRAKTAVVSREGLTILAPIQPPGLIFQAAANYRSHVWEIECAVRRKQGMSAEDAASTAEREAYDRKVDHRLANEAPYIFLGVSHAISGPYDDLVLPEGFGQFPDWEVELGAIFGRTARRVQRENALDYVAGYVICNDVSHRTELNKPRSVLGSDWLSAKNSPGFFPTGPYLVPAAFVPDPMDLRIQFRLNGKTCQDESTKGMIYDVRRLIAYLSLATIAKPGDMLLTGSPSGNGLHHGRFLQPGDVMEAEITGLGLQRNHVVAEEAVK